MYFRLAALMAIILLADIQCQYLKAFLRDAPTSNSQPMDKFIENFQIKFDELPESQKYFESMERKWPLESDKIIYNSEYNSTDPHIFLDIESEDDNVSEQVDYKQPHVEDQSINENNKFLKKILNNNNRFLWLTSKWKSNGTKITELAKKRNNIGIRGATATRQEQDLRKATGAEEVTFTNSKRTSGIVNRLSREYTKKNSLTTIENALLAETDVASDSKALKQLFMPSLKLSCQKSTSQNEFTSTTQSINQLAKSTSAKAEPSGVKLITLPTIKTTELPYCNMVEIWYPIEETPRPFVIHLIDPSNSPEFFHKLSLPTVPKYLINPSIQRDKTPLDATLGPIMFTNKNQLNVVMTNRNLGPQLIKAMKLMDKTLLNFPPRVRYDQFKMPVRVQPLGTG